MKSRFELTAPTTWNDLPAKQLKEVAVALLGNVELTEKRLLCLFAITGKGRGWWKKNANTIQVADSLHHTDFLFKSIGRTDPPFPDYKGLVAPLPRFEQLCFSEFSFCDKRYRKWKESGDETALCELCGALYRKPLSAKTQEKPDFTGDRRHPFSSFQAKRNARYWRKAPPWRKVLVAWWFQACRELVEMQFHALFSGGVSDVPTHADPWTAFVLDIAGTKFGTVAQTEAAPALEVLLFADESLKRQRKKRKT